MMRYAENQQQLIDRVKLALNADSFYKVSQISGVSQSALGRAYQNQHFLSDYNIILLCDLSGLEPLQTLAFIRKEEAESKGNEKAVKLWKKHASAA